MRHIMIAKLAARRMLLAATVALGYASNCGPAFAQLFEAKITGEFTHYDQMYLPGFTFGTGDVAFDPIDGTLYALLDITAQENGGLYRFVEDDGVLIQEGPLVTIERPSAMTFTDDGTLWVIRDFGANDGGHLVRIHRPSDDDFETEVAIQQFQTPSDDDSFAVAVVPEGFESDLVRSGDLVIADRGAESNAPHAIYVYAPDDPQGDPDAYAEFLVAPPALAAYDGTNMNDIAFAIDGSRLFVSFESGALLSILPDGTIESELFIEGFTPVAPRGLAMAPDTERLFVADSGPDEIWSIDPETGAAELEVTLESRFENLNAVIHDPTLTFSPDGSQLALAETNGHVWIFHRGADAPGNGRPIARLRTDLPSAFAASVEGESATFQLDASLSDDGDDGAQGLSYDWRLLHGTSDDVEFSAPNSVETSVTFFSSGIFIIGLVVDDGQGERSVHSAQQAFGIIGQDATLETNTFATAQVLPWNGRAGDAIFTPDGELYVSNDDVLQSGGGIYHVPRTDGVFKRGEKVIAVDHSSGLALSDSGDLWIVRDFGAATEPFLTVARDFVSGGRERETAIVQFQTTLDDDPFALAFVPPAFESERAAPGDLLILDHGAENNNTNAIYAYSPDDPQGNPNAYDILFSTAGQLAGFQNLDANELVFSQAGDELYMIVSDGRIIVIGGDGAVARELTPEGASFSHLVGAAIDPVTGHLWVADRTLQQIWSIDTETNLATLEISLQASIFGFIPLRLTLGDPSLTFSSDGNFLTISDAEMSTGGWLWVFTREEEEPEVTFRRGDPDDSGEANISDAIGILNHLFAGTPRPPCWNAADVNGDNAVNIADPVSLLGFLFSGGAEPAAPGPADCGVDPEPSEENPLECEYLSC